MENYMTPGILKSVDSAFVVTNHGNTSYIIKYKGQFVGERGHIKTFINQGGAKAWLTRWVKNIFCQGQYWQSCYRQIKEQSNYEVDFGSTIDILPQYGKTSRFEDPKNKKMFKTIATQLLTEGIFTIEQI